MTEMTPADFAALGGGEAQNSWLWIIVLFFIFAMNGNGFGFGNGNGALTRAELSQGFDNQSVLRKLDGITYGLSDGFYAQNTTMLNGFNG